MHSHCAIAELAPGNNGKRVLNPCGEIHVITLWTPSGTADLLLCTTLDYTRLVSNSPQTWSSRCFCYRLSFIIRQIMRKECN